MERAAVHVVSSRALSTLPFYLPPKTVHQYPLLFLFLATETMPLDARRRTAAVANYRKKNSKELTPPYSNSPRFNCILLSNLSPCGLAARDNLRGSKKEFNKTEDDLKSLQSVAQIIGEVLRPFSLSS
ncbi:unnamed protein product [Brassica oleracea]